MTRPSIIPDHYPDKWFEDEKKIDDAGMWMQYFSVGGKGITDSVTHEPVPEIEHAGVILIHLCPQAENGYTMGSVTFDLPNIGGTGPKWQVQQWEPLTISPSVQHNHMIRTATSWQKVPDTCPLGHGFIREGKWVRA